MNEFFYYATRYGMYFVFLLIIVFIIKALISQTLKKHHSNWNTLINDFTFSTQEFYDLLKKELQEQNIKNISIKEVSLKEGGMFSSGRRYLRILWKDYQYDVCAAPFGKGFFISWWLLYKRSLGEKILSKVPFIGKWLARQWFPVTYYKIDTASMFMTYAQSSVLKVIDDITNSKGVRELTTEERKPILNNIFSR